MYAENEADVAAEQAELSELARLQAAEQAAKARVQAGEHLLQGQLLQELQAAQAEQER